MRALKQELEKAQNWNIILLGLLIVCIVLIALGSVRYHNQTENLNEIVEICMEFPELFYSLGELSQNVNNYNPNANCDFEYEQLKRIMELS